MELNEYWDENRNPTVPEYRRMLFQDFDDIDNSINHHDEQTTRRVLTETTCRLNNAKHVFVPSITQQQCYELCFFSDPTDGNICHSFSMNTTQLFSGCILHFNNVSRNAWRLAHGNHHWDFLTITTPFDENLFQWKLKVEVNRSLNTNAFSRASVNSHFSNIKTNSIVVNQQLANVRQQLSDKTSIIV